MKRMPDTAFRPEGDEPRSQHAALCWRKRRDGVEVLLVTSRETGRWVIPKGWPTDGLDPAQSASREAWEEAGVKGEASAACIGFFSYDKALDRNGKGAVSASVTCIVSVFALQVLRQLKVFPEAGQRRLRWFAQAKAARKVDEPELQALIAAFVPQA